MKGSKTNLITASTLRADGEKLSKLVSALRFHLVSCNKKPGTLPKSLEKALSRLKKALIRDKDAAAEDPLFPWLIAHVVVFAYIWNYLKGRCSMEEQARYLEQIPKGINAGYAPLKELLAVLSHTGEIIPTNFFASLTEISESLKRKFKGKGGGLISGFIGTLFEAFLNHYAPGIQKQYGVYATPVPLVDFMVRSLHSVLKNGFQLSGGIGDERISLFDPAAGTGVFIDSALKLAVDTLTGNRENVDKSEFIRDYLGHRCLSCETLLFPYLVNVLETCSRLAEGQYSLVAPPGGRVWRCNTLKIEWRVLLEEITGQRGEDSKGIIPVILGNPPYSNNPAVVGTLVDFYVKDYYLIAGQRLQERNLKSLYDDYLKFLRQAQLVVEKAGHGIVAFVTPNTWPDNITFRGMRYSLLQSFDEIYVLNLNGDFWGKKEIPYPGIELKRDQTIFNANAGIAITFLIKYKQYPGRFKMRDGSVYYSEISGTKAVKYQCLQENDVYTLAWRACYPVGDYYFFKPKEHVKYATSLYRHFFKITEIFNEGSTGIVTARDTLTISYKPGELLEKVRSFLDMEKELARVVFNLRYDTRDWTVQRAKQDILENGIDRSLIFPILYRPFDLRYTYYTGKCRGFHCMPRYEIMKHLLLENMALVTVRQVNEGKFNHCFVSNTLVDARVTTNNRGIAYIYPLYTYRFPSEEKNKNKNVSGLLQGVLSTGHVPRKPNIDPGFFDLLVEKVGFAEPPTVEQVFYYIYAVLFSTTYRETYSEQLRGDFPCVPFTTDAGVFMELARLGEELSELHLFTSPRLRETVSTFNGVVDHTVLSKHVRFVCSDETFIAVDTQNSIDLSIVGRVYINKYEYFDNITIGQWLYELCGYRVLEKWLKIRSKDKLDDDGIDLFKRVVRAVELTMECQERIDGLFDQVEETLLER